MSGTVGSPEDYVRLQQGQHGLILALACTVLAVLGLTVASKLYLTYRKIARDGLPSAAILASDALWLAAHIIGMVYIAIRISTLPGLTDDRPAPLSSQQISSIATHDRACQVLFILTLYLSFCSVFSTVLMIRRTPREVLVYAAPAVVFVVGLLLATLPFIGCNKRHIFAGEQALCPSGAARALPALVVLMLLDIIISIYWPIFVLSQQRQRLRAGGISPSQPWPVVPFLLRFLTVGAIIAYIDLQFRYDRSAAPYSGAFYAELLAVLSSLTATSSISMSKVLSKFSFGGVAYTEEPRSRSYNASGGAGGSGSGQRTGNASGAQASHSRSQHQQSQLRSRADEEGAWSPELKKWAGWGGQGATLRSQAERRGSGESEAQILDRNGISRRVEIDVLEERTSAKNSHVDSL